MSTSPRTKSGRWKSGTRRTDPPGSERVQRSRCRSLPGLNVVVGLAEQLSEADAERIGKDEDPIQLRGRRRVLDADDRLMVTAGTYGETYCVKASERRRAPPTAANDQRRR